MASLKLMLSFTLHKIIMLFTVIQLLKVSRQKYGQQKLHWAPLYLLRDVLVYLKISFLLLARSVLAVKHWRTGAKQKSSTPLLNGKTLT